MSAAFPPRRILVPVDFSGVSEPSLRHAKELARRFRAAVHVAYVQEPPPMTEGMLAEAAYHEGSPKDEILRRLRQIAGKGPSLHVPQGDAVAAILRLADEIDADLLIMGAHEATGLRRLWLGSVVEDVVRRSPVPVLTLHGGPREIRSILAPVNFTPQSDEGLRFAARVAAAFRTPLTALHISNEEDMDTAGVVDAVKARLPKPPASRISVGAKLRRGSPTEEILKEGGRHGWIVIAAQPKAMLRDWVLGTTVERLLRFSSTPVLTVPALPIKPRKN